MKHKAGTNHIVCVVSVWSVWSVCVVVTEAKHQTPYRMEQAKQIS
jgi:hypothetical protein